MRKNLFIVLAVLTGIVVSMASCDRLGEDIAVLERKALKDNLGLTTVDIAAIQGVTAPATGATPVTQITGNAQYTGTVTWSPAVSGTFAAETPYTATVTLMPKTGYTLQAVTANFFTVAGATAKNGVNSGVITAVFPKTGPTELSEDVWADGVVSANGEQWFKFTATASTQYIQVNFGTLTSLYVQLYDNASNTVGSQTNLSKNGTTSYVDISWLVTRWQEYLIKVTPGMNSNGGTYQIAFSTSGTKLPSQPITLKSVTANGSSATQTTTQLTLTFDNAIDGLSATDITLSGVSGVSKGRLSGSNPYTLPISGFTSGGTLNVVISKIGYTINGSPMMVGIYYYFNLSVKMVQIPGGTFTMGQTGVATPEHSVTLSAFKMGKYQVTQEQYQAVMGNNPSYFTSSPATGEVQGKRPVEQVSWYDALVFCNKLSMMEGLSPAYSISGRTDPASWGSVPASSNTTWNAVQIVAGSDGYRLPTEAQWEYAARGGNGSPGNYTYSGSNTVGDVAWYYYNSGNKTHEVGKKTPNGLGLYDMSGNVFELCWDWSGDYTSGAQTDPVGASSGSYRVLRGGGWGDSAEYARSSSRNLYFPYDGFNRLGFRLVRP